jgi:hypothetical protein
LFQRNRESVSKVVLEKLRTEAQGIHHNRLQPAALLEKANQIHAKFLEDLKIQNEKFDLELEKQRSAHKEAMDRLNAEHEAASRIFLDEVAKIREKRASR